MTVPDVSVVIAAYNVEAYIERAIRSALGQQDVAVEVVVADDASKDATLARIRSIDDPRLTCIALPRNAGPGAARNAAIGASKAPWVAVLDGDDEIEPQRLARCLHRARAAHADIVIDNLTVRREEGNRHYLMYAPEMFARAEPLALAEFIRLNSNFLDGMALGYVKPVMSRVFLQAHGLAYDETLRIGEDYILLAEALAGGAVCAFEPSAGYLYTARAGSTSHRLLPDDIRRMESADRTFMARHSLDGRAKRAQRRRSSRLREALVFMEFVDAVKAHKPGEALRAALSCPPAMLNLWRPVLRRLGG